MLVGLAVGGWGGNTYFQALAVQSAKLIAAGARLYVEPQQ